MGPWKMNEKIPGTQDDFEKFLCWDARSALGMDKGEWNMSARICTLPLPSPVFVLLLSTDRLKSHLSRFFLIFFVFFDQDNFYCISPEQEARDS